MDPAETDSHDDLVGARIRETRRRLGLTQEALAQAVGVSRSAVAQWETGRAGQLRGNLARIGAVLGVSVTYLMAGGDSDGPPVAENGTELALLRLYRACSDEDRAFLLRTAHRLARAAAAEPESPAG